MKEAFLQKKLTNLTNYSVVRKFSHDFAKLEIFQFS